MGVHPTAVVPPEAQLGRDVSIGAYSILGPEVRLADRVLIHAHVVLDGRTTLGEGTEVFPFSMLGARPGHHQDRGEGTELQIGARCVIRESASVHRGTNGGSGKTVIGDDCMILGQIHIAHDCRLGRHVTMMNGCLMAGHVEIGDFATLGGNAEIHQFVRIGAFAMLGGGATVRMDVPPYCMAAGYGPGLHGLNEVGLERKGFSSETVKALRSAYRILFRLGLPRAEALQRVRSEHGSFPEVATLAEFVASSKRGIARHGRSA
ncbi:MAG TPA: acyl-ACP--UDP-N-acetylglucosamine O-acyltransferase [Planctomycetota bacterium]|nr:acyl-ACP--UDP-N-acetylglucosamine O-acyltransferase [Planctomycetota bacterium]